MKERIRRIIFVMVISFGIGLIGCAVIYWLLPKVICCVVQDVHTSNLYQSHKEAIKENVKYVECFVPQQYSYIKQIVLHISKDAQEIEIGETGKERYGAMAHMKVEDKSGNILVQKKIALSNETDFVSFPVERWVIPGEEYRFIVSFSGCDHLSLTFGPDDMGPVEHRELEINNEKVDKALFMQYVYGGYSKKLLLFWLLILSTLACLLVEDIQHWYGKVKRN